MSVLTDRLSRLTPKQRLLLESRLRKAGGAQPGAAKEPSWLAGEERERALAFWRGLLEELPAERGLAGRPTSGAGGGYQGRSELLPPAWIAEIRALARRHEVSETLLAAALVAALLYRCTGRARQLIGCPVAAADGGEVLPILVDGAGELSFASLVERLKAMARRIEGGGLLPLRQLVHELDAAGVLSPGESLLPIAVWKGERPPAAEAGRELGVRLGEEEGEIAYDAARLDPGAAAGFALHFGELLAAAGAFPERPLAELPLYGAALQARFLDTGPAPLPGESTFPEAFAAQVRQNPELPAIAGGWTVSYRELDERSNRLARCLLQRGLEPEDRIGLFLPLSGDWLVALLAVLKAGGTAVPIDAGESPARLRDAVAETRPRWLLTSSRQMAAESPGPAWLAIDSLVDEIARQSAAPLALRALPMTAALAIPAVAPPGGRRWVLLSQASLLRLLRSLDGEIGCGPGDALPLSPPLSHGLLVDALWPLARGARVVIASASEPSTAGAEALASRLRRRHPVSFSLFYFASAETQEGDHWRLLFEGAKFADRHDFEAVWTPERHFHPFGGLFPNPGVTNAALAMITERVHLRAGSVVLPLHHPVRVAEEWALVDNYSHGRAGIAFASGWHADDFVFSPESFADRREVMFQGIETIQRLWRGEAVPARGGRGQELEIRIYPRPVQPELPIWITAAATSDTVARAGRMGTHLLSNLLGQGPEGLALKVRQYREARAEGGHDPDAGRFTLMLHTFLGDDVEIVRETVRPSFSAYLRSFGGLLQNQARSMNLESDTGLISEADKEQVLAFAFERYSRDSALFGTPRSCMEMIRYLEEIGVDEVACLIDFGVDVESALAGLHQLDRLRELAERSSPPPVPAAARGTGGAVSLVRVGTPDTEPSPAAGVPRVVLLDSRTPHSAPPPGLAGSRTLRFRGEAETGGWSSVLAGDPSARTPPVLRPLSGMRLLVLRGGRELAPVGMPGELCVQGEGLARGYLDQPSRTAERFLPSPFEGYGERLYRTGHAARYRPDGGIEWIGLYGKRGEVLPLSSRTAAEERTALTVQGTKEPS